MSPGEHRMMRRLVQQTFDINILGLDRVLGAIDEARAGIGSWSLAASRCDLAAKRLTTAAIDLGGIV